jgi:hypothetical protein
MKKLAKILLATLSISFMTNAVEAPENVDEQMETTREETTREQPAGLKKSPDRQTRLHSSLTIYP